MTKLGSEVLNVVEIGWISNSLPQGLPILDVGCQATYPRVENISQGILSEKQIAYDPHALANLRVSP